MNHGKCPKCQAVIQRIVLSEMAIRKDRMATMGGDPGFALLCPECETIISVAYDPVRLKNQIIEEIKVLLKKNSR